MLDLNYLFYKLLIKYHIFDNEPELYRIYYDCVYRVCMNNFFDDYPQETKIAIRGYGHQCRKILNCLTYENKKKIRCIIDKTTFYDVNGEELAFVSSSDIDIVVVGSYIHKESIEQEYLKAGIVVKNPYEEIVKMMYLGDDNYLKCEDTEFRHITYVDINECLWNIDRLNVNDERFFKYTNKLFSYLIEIKDFYNANKYLERYLKNSDTYENNKMFLTELNSIIENASKTVKNKSKKDIVINWIDNVCADDFYSGDKVNELLGDSMIFHNVYTVTPWTHTVFNVILSGEYPMATNNFDNNRRKYTEDNSKLLSLLKKKGYIFKYYCNPGLYANQLPEESRQDYIRGFEKVIFGERAMSECSTRHQWDALCDRLATKEPVCFLIHNLCEVHDPYVYVERDLEIVRFGEKREKHIAGMNSLIDQLIWYGRYGKMSDLISVYMSDHGDFWETSHSYDKKRVNILFAIQSSNIKRNVCNELISLIDFYKIIGDLIDIGEINLSNIKRDYVLIENYDIESDNVILNFLNLWRKNTTINLNAFKVKAVITKDEFTFAKYACGYNVIRKNGRKIDLIDAMKYIDEIEQKANVNIEELIECEYSNKSKRLYEYLEVLGSETIDW